jgi:formamidopyrimidine-DNA glycosylase
MPELPEVQTIIDEINSSRFIGQVIQQVLVFYPKTILGDIHQLEGRQLIEGKRIGKYLLLKLDRGYLIGHLRMTGRLVVDDIHQHHERFRLIFSKGTISYVDPRTFGRWGYFEEYHQHLSHVGKDALEETFDPEEIFTKIKKSKRAIKAFLLDQKTIAGLGNIYADETLWEAKIHPAKLCSECTQKEVAAILIAMKKVLKRAVQARGTSLDDGKGNYQTFSGVRGTHQNFLKVYQQKKCQRCAEPLKKIVVAQRGTHYCPHCQKK